MNLNQKFEHPESIKLKFPFAQASERHSVYVQVKIILINIATT